jgi:hypothetical protein
MNDVIVVTYCTHSSGTLELYKEQLKSSDIPLHIETVPLNGTRETFISNVTMRWKVNLCKTILPVIKSYKTVFITDAWDVQFFGSKQELLDKSPDCVTISAERNCWPESDIAGKINGDTPWKYANSQIAAPVDCLEDWLNKVEVSSELDVMEQTWFNRRLSEGSELVCLDSTTKLFYVVSGWLEDGTVKYKDGRLWNSLCGTVPNFVHCSGETSLELLR